MDKKIEEQMENIYMGEFEVNLKTTPYADYKRQDWAMYFIESYGQIDGAHHKQWMLDQVARILKGTPVNVRVAKWKNGMKEYRVTTGEPSNEYLKWVEEMKGDVDEEGDYEYDYDEGIIP